MDLDSVKQLLKDFVKVRYSNIIYKTYPIWKQGNIDNARCGATAQEKNTMDNFINGKWNDIGDVEAAIDALLDTSVVDNFVTGSDLEMAAYVNSYMPSLVDHDQLIAVAVAIQSVRAMT